MCVKSIDPDAGVVWWFRDGGPSIQIHVLLMTFMYFCSTVPVFVLTHFTNYIHITDDCFSKISLC